MTITALSDPLMDPRVHADAPATFLTSVRLRLVRAVDSRPPARSWAGTVLSPTPLQPSLPTLETGLDRQSEQGPQPEQDSQSDQGPWPDPARGAPLLVGHTWTATPSPELPDAAAWSGQLARVLVETLHGQRPVGQLTRWVDEWVLASVIVLLRGRAARTRRSATGATLGPGALRHEPSRRPPVLQSVRVQCPSPEVLEVSVHVRVGHRSEAVAFRLEGWCDRWLCTALEIGPRHGRGVEDA